MLVPIANPSDWTAISWISGLTDMEKMAVIGAGVVSLVLVLVLTTWCICLLHWRRRLLKQAMGIVAHAARPAIPSTPEGSAPPSPAHTIKETSASAIGSENEGGRAGVENGQHTFGFADTSKVVVEAGERFVIVMIRPQEGVVAQECCTAPGGLPEPVLSDE